MMFRINGTHARAVNDRWAYKLSAGGYSRRTAYRAPDAGSFPATQTPYPAFVNEGTTQPKFDGRAGLRRRRRPLQLGSRAATPAPTASSTPASGRSTSTRGVGLGYGTVRYARGRCASMSSPTSSTATRRPPSFGSHGRPIRSISTPRRSTSKLATCTPSAPAASSATAATSATTASTCRSRRCGDNRTEVGGYIQDEIFLVRHVRAGSTSAPGSTSSTSSRTRWSRRGRADPQAARDHAIRTVVNKAFRSPSLINNFLDVAIVNQLELRAVDLDQSGLRAARHVQLPGAGGRQRRDLKEEIDRGRSSRLHRDDQQPCDGVGGGLEFLRRTSDEIFHTGGAHRR